MPFADFIAAAQKVAADAKAAAAAPPPITVHTVSGLGHTPENDAYQADQAAKAKAVWLKLAAEAEARGDKTGAAFDRAQANGFVPIIGHSYTTDQSGAPIDLGVVGTGAYWDPSKHWQNTPNGDRVNVGDPLPEGHVYTTGPGTFFSPYLGEVGNFPGDVQFDLFTFWLRTKFNPPEVGAWYKAIADRLWGHNAAAAQWFGGDFGSRSLKVTPELLHFGTIDDPKSVEFITADVASHGETEIFSKTTREVFVERYGWGLFHPGPDVGTILADAAKITVGAIIAVAGVLTGGVLSAGGAKLIADGVQSTVNDAGTKGAKIPGDVSEPAKIFALLAIPPTGATSGRMPWAGIIGVVLLGGGVWYFTKKGVG